MAYFLLFFKAKEISKNILYKAIANYVYSDKNGNQGGDDGWNFIGRGFFHLTGRIGYSNFNNYINKNFNTEDNTVENPTLVAEYGKYAIMSAAWF